MSLSRHAQNWEDLGAVDPLWAILSYPENRFGKGDVESFFRSGDREIDRVMRTAERLGYPRERDSVLDFGCGVGRLAPALATRFQTYYGVDIAASMIAGAERYHARLANCHFIVNREDNLRRFDDGQLDLVYTNNVLQHLPSRTLIRSYLREFARVIRPGGLIVFQLPDHLSFGKRLQPRRRLYPIFRSVGFSEQFIYRRLGIAPMSTTFVPEREVAPFLTGLGGRILHVQRHLGRPGDD
ncbi:MAG: class I SAM-dependent methyltransferase, partial [Candidatus Dormibacteraceae bacterium]